MISFIVERFIKNLRNEIIEEDHTVLKPPVALKCLADTMKKWTLSILKYISSTALLILVRIYSFPMGILDFFAFILTIYYLFSINNKEKRILSYDIGLNILSLELTYLLLLLFPTFAFLSHIMPRHTFLSFLLSSSSSLLLYFYVIIPEQQELGKALDTVSPTKKKPRILNYTILFFLIDTLVSSKHIADAVLASKWPHLNADYLQLSFFGVSFALIFIIFAFLSNYVASKIASYIDGKKKLVKSLKSRE
ncbi:hypothetical protein GINT2_000530 [Glugoides intestinalis]